MSARIVFLFALVILIPATIIALRPMHPSFVRPPMYPVNSENLRKSFYSLCYTKESQVEGDSCYGCFTRVTSGLMCNTTERLLAKCAKDHLKDTKFEKCSMVFEDCEDGKFNASALCEFESCIRRINLEVIIDECAKEMPEGATLGANYLNMTACVLAKHRCKSVRREMYGPRIHTLMVTDDYQLRISEVPPMMNGFECIQDYSQTNMVQPASWPSAKCDHLSCQ